MTNLLLLMLALLLSTFLGAWRERYVVPVLVLVLSGLLLYGCSASTGEWLECRRPVEGLPLDHPMEPVFVTPVVDDVVLDWGGSSYSIRRGGKWMTYTPAPNSVCIIRDPKP